MSQTLSPDLLQQLTETAEAHGMTAEDYLKILLQQNTPQTRDSLNELADELPDYIVRFDRQYRYLYVNRATADNVGISPADLINCSIAEAGFSHELATMYENALEKVFTTGEKLNFSFVVEVDKPVRHMEAQLVPQFDANGEVETVISIIREVTQRIEAELALYESESRYQAILNSSIDFICRYTPDSILTYVNDAYCRYFNRTREELIGQSFLILSTGNQIDGILERLREVIHNPAPHVRHFFSVGEDGQRRWVQWVDHGITDETGRVVEIQAVGRDITDLVRSIEALSENEQLLQTIIDHIPVMLTFFDNAGSFRFISHHMVEKLGWSLEELINHPDMLSLFYPDPEEYERALQWMLNPRLGIWKDFRTHTKDGRTLDTSWANIPLPDGSNIGIGQEISDRVQLEMERLRSRTLEFELEKERELAELKAQFTAMISHDFRTPLTVVKSSVDIIRKYSHRLTPDQVQARLDGINDQIHRMTRLLDDIMLYSRGMSDKLEFEPSAMDLVSYCEYLLDNLRLTDNSDHILQLDVHTEPGPVLMDQDLLENILSNLLSNALKYAPSGTTVTLGIDRHDEKLIMSVSDEGIGIPIEDQARLFEPFHRANNARHIPGTGLGLAIVRNSVEAHGGHIQYRSAEGSGSEFIISLPYMSATAEV